MANRLAQSTSPYLLQHKDNPVDWHEWGDAAFAEARDRDVPVILSVGYSACHWCHVMAHESFEDEETALEMNLGFVNIKVDREERPDVDAVYMEAVQAMSGRGGWPMTVFMTPEGRPFYAGTYFPDKDRHGMPSFRRVLAAITEAWADRRGELVEQADRLTAAINRDLPAGEDLGGTGLLENAYRAIETTFDAINGGFGDAPKFPQQPVLELLLRLRGRPWAGRADEMLTVTLEGMADGGIHDQLGGGFARYSVDREWLVPHFEKMLYDNAQLARVYLWAGLELDSIRFLDVARRTLDYMLTDLRHPSGGLYSAEDADSEGVEGKFYVWSHDDLEAVLGEEDAEVASLFFGCTPGGNFEGANILHRPTGQAWTPQLESIRRRLLDARSERVRPGLDDKVITAWNGLAIRALAEAGVVLDEPGYIEAAEQAAGFIVGNLLVDETLMRSWRQGRTSVPGFVDDYGAMAVALFSLFSATGEVTWFRNALNLTRSLERFERPEGGYFSTSADGEPLIKRPMDITDNPLPSGNALAAEANILAGLFTGESAFLDKGHAALRSAVPIASRFPSMVGHHLSLLGSVDEGLRELAIVGEEWRAMAATYWDAYRPEVALAVAAGPTSEVPLLRDRFVAGETNAYLCEGFVCELPVTTPPELAELLAGRAT